MSCYSPVKAWIGAEGGTPAFKPVAGKDRILWLPCGGCVGCRLDHKMHWQTRLYHESLSHKVSMFLTLTYADEHLPWGSTLVPEHLQNFLKKIRRYADYHAGLKLRFYACGEYGDKTHRPHYHLLLFGLWPKDSEFLKLSPAGHRLFRSETVLKLWKYGHADFGSVTPDSCSYVAGYVTKKITGKASYDHYERITEDGSIYYVCPEFARMSLKPGIGADWFQANWSEVYPDDEVIVNGKSRKPPKYYDVLLERMKPDLYASVKAKRKEAMQTDEVYLEQHPKRLAAKAKIATQRNSMLRTSIDT